MKKIASLSILLFTLMFVACDNDDDNDVYLDNNLLAGYWYETVAKDSAIYTFIDNQFYKELYAHIAGMEGLKYEGKEDMGNYLLTDSLILLPTNNASYIYRLSTNKDTLFLRNPIDQPIIWHSLTKIYPIICDTK